MIQQAIIFRNLTVAGSIALAIFSCSQVTIPDKLGGGSTSNPGTNSSFLYVASGVCNGGGNTTYAQAAASNLVYRINLSTGNRDSVLADYNSAGGYNSPGDSPVGINEGPNSDTVYVLVENATSPSVRRIDRIEKKPAGVRVLNSNLPGTSGTVLRSMSPVSGGYLFARSAAVERVAASNGTRVPATSTTNPYINAPAATCTTSTSIVKTLSLNNGAIVYLNNAAGQNRIGIISSGGYTLTTDCRSVQAAPTPTSNPTAMVYDRVNNKLLVAYSNNNTAINQNAIYSYNINESTFAITNPQKLYDANAWPGTHPYLLYAISEMVLDSVNNQIYISTATTTATTVAGYKIMRFNYDASKIGIDNSNVLGIPAGADASDPVFYSAGLDTRCISQMIISN
jgi:hypothetical protein